MNDKLKGKRKLWAAGIAFLVITAIYIFMVLTSYVPVAERLEGFKMYLWATFGILTMFGVTNVGEHFANGKK